PGNPLKLSDIASVAKSRARLVQRPPGAGAQLLLLALLARANIAANDLALMTPVCATGMDIAQAVRSNRADCGIATRSVALAAGSLTAAAAVVAACEKDQFLEGVHHEEAERAQPTQGQDRRSQEGCYDVPCPNRHRQWDRHHVRNHERSRC